MARTRSADVVVFDLGGVVIDWNPRYLFRKLLDEDAAERFLGEVCTQDWNERQDAGRPFRDGVAELCARFPEHATLIRAYDERWPEMLGGPVTGTSEIVRELFSRGTPLYALTNWSAEKFVHARDGFDVLKCFRGVVVSGDEGIIKPDPRLFELLFSRYAIEPSRAVFIDDSPRNVEAAARLGMDALRFSDAGTLRAELEARGLLA